MRLATNQHLLAESSSGVVEIQFKALPAPVDLFEDYQLELEHQKSTELFDGFSSFEFVLSRTEMCGGWIGKDDPGIYSRIHQLILAASCC